MFYFSFSAAPTQKDLVKICFFSGIQVNLNATEVPWPWKYSFKAMLSDINKMQTTYVIECFSKNEPNFDDTDLKYS